MRIYAYRCAGDRVKKRVSVTIDEAIAKEAKQLGLNISRICENTLKMYIYELSSKKDSLVRLPGFEPGSSTWQKVDWSGFQTYVNKEHRPRVARQLISNAEKYGECLFNRDLSTIRDLPDGTRANAMGSLAALSKFIGRHEDFLELKKSYAIKWGGKNPDEIFIERLQKIQDPEEIWNWVKSAKEAYPGLSKLLDLLSITGLRLSEGVASYNLIISLATSGKLGSYYFPAVDRLEHFRFKDIFLRKSKKAFFSFAPYNIVEKIASLQPYVSTDAVSKRLSKQGLSLRFADIREAHGTHMIRYLKKEEIDALHGRVTNGVFMQHYFNPALIGDLRERAFKGIAEIQEKIKT